MGPFADLHPHTWRGGALYTETVTVSPARIPIDAPCFVAPEFVERPGLAELDLLSDFGDFLVEVGLHTPGASPYDLSLDWGDIGIETGGALRFEGDGIPDVAELALLQTILRDVHLNETARHGVAHIHTWEDFRFNQIKK